MEIDSGRQPPAANNVIPSTASGKLVKVPRNNFKKILLNNSFFLFKNQFVKILISGQATYLILTSSN